MVDYAPPSFDAILGNLGDRARQLRLLRDLSQAVLAARAGVGLVTVRRFERSGRASVANVLRIAFALGVDDAFSRLFELPKYASIDEALARPALVSRQRAGRKRR